jgi:hypothetical protein
LPVIDPLADFSAERLSQFDAAAKPRVASKPAIVRPARRLLEVRRASPMPATRVSHSSASADHKVMWSFLSGSVVGAALCLIVVSLLTASALPQRDPIPIAPEPVSAAPIETPAAPPVAAADDRSARPAVQHEPPPPAPTPARDARQSASPSAPKETSRGPFVGSLRIQSTPPGARVFINRVAMGVTPVIVGNLSAGSHAVRVEADGHLSWSSAVRVVADRQTNINTTLSPTLEKVAVRR